MRRRPTEPSRSGAAMLGALALVLLPACHAPYPEGRIACATAADCPPSWLCAGMRCYSTASAIDGSATDGSASDGGLDVGPDVARDAQLSIDASADADPRFCSTHAECDDGMFCNGTEGCYPGMWGPLPLGCWPGNFPCPLMTDTCREDWMVHCMTCSPEVCNMVDDDCDAVVDEGALFTFYRDMDGDGWGGMSEALGCWPPPGPPGLFVTTGGDCDDSVGSIHPEAVELCNRVDDDCDGTTDELVGPC